MYKPRITYLMIMILHLTLQTVVSTAPLRGDVARQRRTDSEALLQARELRYPFESARSDASGPSTWTLTRAPR